ncbi:ABC transporter permease [Prescottella agglutinans]|uniref:ABC-2 type transport system permease protein n=1 Tax=Prescottella agglutinans TaxID=1644129 RepID=A0ABT6MF41_9NOCA|nr:ABC transporter permease [Prescottella agglutinans]MDH6282933.1 ABC-2 type transport system permease protein [Prescottella agglutinans]
MSHTTSPADTRSGTAPSERCAGTLTAYRWEIAKLAAQARARYSVLGCLIAPVVAVLILAAQQTLPKDTLFGRHIHDSGYAMPLLVLGFAAQWILPLLTALVAGDIFASEDHYGTWKTLLTRSVSRAQIFWAKTLAAATFAVLVLTVLATSTIVSSLLVVGRQPLVGLTGQVIPPGTAAVLVPASWASELAPLLGFTALAVLLSVLTRTPAAGVAAPVVIGLVMELLSGLGGLNGARQLLLTTPFSAWHGLFTADRFYGTLTTGLVVSAAWTVVCLALSYVSLRRRDITGG